MYHPLQLRIFADVYTNDPEIENQSRLVSNGSGQTTVEIWHSHITVSASGVNGHFVLPASFQPSFAACRRCRLTTDVTLPGCAGGSYSGCRR
ncbi:hypothetical protein MKW98_014523 [Papaver atlanticum]|uniref:Uncharacterized protein n=1 Tax=Papaver atlanticum TaxID=357466 RepID=A0AAD4XH72_9MAGN|nr:hypothetical protein MKW98_014523 [Papaver atlanticum]